MELYVPVLALAGLATLFAVGSVIMPRSSDRAAPTRPRRILTLERGIRGQRHRRWAVASR